MIRGQVLCFASLLLSSAVLPAQVTTCGQAVGTTPYSLSNACEPKLVFNITGECLSACGDTTLSFNTQPATSTGVCLGIVKCVPDFGALNFYNIVSREFYSVGQSRAGGQCGVQSQQRASTTCPCVRCGANGPGGPNNNPSAGEDPLLISLTDGEYRLSSRTTGVAFDLNADGNPERTAWTLAGSDDAFLVLDRNGNGTIDNGLEIFGDETPQLPSSEPNGFRALAVFDDTMSGGNGDGRIDEQDVIFASLRLWTDADHDGTSAASELEPLSTWIEAIDLGYQAAASLDRHGNEFRYWANVRRTDGSSGAIVAWNVFFASR